jgi:predicted ATPase
MTPEIWFEHALQLARRQHARSLELRATMGLSRLWLAQGKRGPARQRLASIYGWFSEGVASADLQAAKALLEACR